MTRSSSAKLLGVPSSDLWYFWPQVEPMITAAVAESANRWTTLEVLERLLARDMQLWVVIADKNLVGVVVTEIYPTAAGKTCALPIVGGEILPHLELLGVIKAWADEAGCVRLEGMGRPGWERAVKKLGWRKIMTVYEARL